MKNFKVRRKFWLTVHLYIGLFAGAVFVLIGVAGSLSVFGPEIDTALNSSIKKTQGKLLPSASFQSMDDIAAAAIAVMPAQGKPYALVFPSQPDENFIITYSTSTQALNQSEWFQVFVNPYTAAVVGQRLMFDTGNPWRGSLMHFFVRFHYTLAIGEIGSSFVGIVALLLLFLILTGLLLWCPSPAKLWTALVIKRYASVHRFNFDLHKTFGFYGSLVLLIVLVSGLEMVFPNYVDGLIKVFSHSALKSNTPVSIPTDTSESISLAQVVATTEKRFPDGAYKWIFFPQGRQDAYRVVKRSPEEVNRTRPRRTLWIDQYSGKILQERDPIADSSGDVFLQWLYPLHNGEAFGVAGRIIIAITGLVPMVLYITGVIIWRQKLRAKKQSFNRHSAS